MTTSRANTIASRQPGWVRASHRVLSLASADGRRLRMLALLTAIVVLSAGDLVLTLGHMSTTGMYEANPLVAALARLTESSLSIANFKALTVLIGVGLLYRLRRHASAELAAWLVAAILVALSIQWNLYTAEIGDLSLMVQLELAGHHDAGWVVFDG